MRARLQLKCNEMKRERVRRGASVQLQVCLLVAVLFIIVFVVGFVRWVAPDSPHTQPVLSTTSLSMRPLHGGEAWMPSTWRNANAPSAHVSGMLHRHVRTDSNATKSVLHLAQHKKLSHDTYYLGKKRHPHHGYEMEGYAFLHMHSSEARIGPHLTKKVHFNRTQQHLSSCTAPISPGTYWKRSRGYWIHPENRHGLSEEFMREAYAAASDRWQCALDSTKSLPAGPFLGFVDGPMDTTAPTGRNECAMGTIHGRPGTVGVTISTHRCVSLFIFIVLIFTF